MSGNTLKIILLACVIGAAAFSLSSNLLSPRAVVADQEEGIASSVTGNKLATADLAIAVGLSSATNTLPLNTSLIFGGDVMLSRVVGQKMVKYDNFNWPFEKIKDVLNLADIAAINLESPFTLGSKSYLVPTGSFSFNADPQTLAGLATAGIDLVTLANNHFVNQGQKGMRDTFSLLSDAGIDYVGAGNNDQEAHQEVIIEKSGIKFAFLGYGYPDDYSVADADSAGIATMTLPPAIADVKRVREQADVVIVMIHDGVEYTNIPTSHQKEFARAMIDAGADLIIGHHPHWVQQVETYRGKPIVYSLGNLIFDQMWSQETREGALVRIDFSGKQLWQLEFLPIVINDYGQPQLVTNQAQKDKILKRMGLGEAVLKIE